MTRARRFRELSDRMPIRKQIVAVCAAIALGTAGIVAGSAAYVARSQAVQDEKAALLDLARNMADRLDTHMAERSREIKNIAGLELLTSTWSENPGQIRNVLNQIQASLSEYAWIGFATPDGVVRSATGAMLEGASVTSRPWFIEGLHHPTMQDVHAAKLLEALLPAHRDGAPFRFVDVAMPVYGREGRLAGVLGAHLSWSWAEDVRRVVLATQHAADKTEIWVLAADGTVLLGPRPESLPFTANQLAQSTFIDTTAPDARLAASVRTEGQPGYPKLGWRVIAFRPLAVALEPAARLTRLIVILGALAALIGIAIAWIVGNAISGPIARLTSNVGQIGRNPKANLSIEHGSVEIATLSIALRSLLRRVGSAEKKLSQAEQLAEEARFTADVTLRSSEEKTRRLGADLEILRYQAETDPLTGLLNRRAFLPFADDAMNYFKRYGRQVSIIMFDIDRFKGVNDTFGHAAGDAVIQTIANVIGAQIRTTDKLARFGGEEFVVLLRECDASSADLLANRIRVAASQTLIEFHGRAIQVTISGGIAVAKETDRDIQDVIERADGGLYQAKAAGRNRIRQAGQEGPAVAEAA